MIPLPFLDKIESKADAARPLRRSGFAVILSVVIVSGVAMIAGLSAISMHMNEGRLTTDRGFAVQSRSSAYSCMAVALLRLKQNPGYTGNENIVVDKVVCSIESVVAVGDARTVYARATVNGLTSRIKVEIAEVYEFFVSSWTEMPPS